MTANVPDPVGENPPPVPVTPAAPPPPSNGRPPAGRWLGGICLVAGFVAALGACYLGVTWEVGCHSTGRVLRVNRLTSQTDVWDAGRWVSSAEHAKQLKEAEAAKLKAEPPVVITYGPVYTETGPNNSTRKFRTQFQVTNTLDTHMHGVSIKVANRDGGYTANTIRPHEQTDFNLKVYVGETVEFRVRGSATPVSLTVRDDTPAN